ncbi:MAG: trigger factor [Cyclobacteriaceae bacterium]|nr:trigger factor [Cyclobacteriaceae bacterium]
MEIDLTKKSNTEASIKVRLNKGDYQTHVDKKVLEYSKKVNIKGFRPGKVPPGMVRKLYGKSILVEEINHILSHKLTDYIRENDLKILGEPLPDKESSLAINWDTQEDFEFNYNIGLIDDFKLELNSKHKVKKHIINVDEKALEDTLNDIKGRFGTEVEGETSEEKDVLEVDVQNSDDTIKQEESLLVLNQLDKKAVKKFLGLKIGDTVTMPIEKISDEKQIISAITGVTPEVASTLKGEFTFTVKGLKRQKLAELNQELFDKVFGAGVVSTEKEFIDKVKETISKNYDKEANNFLNLSIRKYLLENINIELPDAFLKEWLMVSDTNLTQEDIDREYSGYADSLKWNMIQNKISKDHEIKVEQEEVKTKATEMILEQFGGPVAAESILDKMEGIAENYLQSENGKHYQEIHDALISEKIMNIIKESISITEKKVTVEEFTKIVSE